jgi:hypothetical protein
MNNIYFTSGNRISSNRRVKDQHIEGIDKRKTERRSNQGGNELALSLENGIIKINQTPLLKYIGMEDKTTSHLFIGLIAQNQYELARSSINSMLILPEEIRTGLHDRILKPGPIKKIKTHPDVNWNEIGNYNCPRILVKIGTEQLWISNPILRSDQTDNQHNQSLENSREELNGALEKSLQRTKK